MLIPFSGYFALWPWWSKERDQNATHERQPIKRRGEENKSFWLLSLDSEVTKYTHLKDCSEWHTQSGVVVLSREFSSSLSLFSWQRRHLCCWPWQACCTMLQHKQAVFANFKAGDWLACPLGKLVAQCYSIRCVHCFQTGWLDLLLHHVDNWAQAALA